MGYDPYSLVRLYDSQTNKNSMLSPTREIRVTSSTRLVGANFNGSTLDPNFWASTVANSGTITQGGGEVRIRTNTSANGSATLSSVRVARFMSSNFNSFRGVIQLGDTGVTNNVRIWGVGDDNDGTFFRLSGTTFSIVTRKATVDTAVNSGSFNGNATTYALDTNAHTYEIIYGSSRVWFLIDDVLIHTVTASITPYSATLSHKILISSTNSGGSTTDASIYARIAAIVRYGEADSRPHFYNNAGTQETRVLKYGPGTLKRIVVNDPGASGAVMTIYDNTAASGTKIATIDLGQLTSAVQPVTIEYGLDFNLGMTYVTSGANPGDVTIVYE